MECMKACGLWVPPLWLATITSILADIGTDLRNGAISIVEKMLSWLLSMWQGYDVAYTLFGQNDEEAQQGSSYREREYIFVNYNAWEYNRSDELWAALIRNLYTKAELRMEKNRDVNGNPHDWKWKWRVKKAKELLIERYGGIAALRIRVAVSVLFALSVVVGVTQFIINRSTLLHEAIETTIGFVSTLVVFIASIFPAVQLARHADQDAGSSRGDVLLKEANRVKDDIGFLGMVSCTSITPHSPSVLTILPYNTLQRGLKWKLKVYFNT